MKVSTRRQQGQKGTTKLKEICPDCQKQYLENLYAKKKGKSKAIGKYCPAVNCNYHRIDKERSEQ